LIRNGRNQVDPLTSGMKPDCRGLLARRAASAVKAVVAKEVFSNLFYRTGQYMIGQFVVDL
jgi:hypothetical protein